jgi:hypothetical protein
VHCTYQHMMSKTYSYNNTESKIPIEYGELQLQHCIAVYTFSSCNFNNNYNSRPNIMKQPLYNPTNVIYFYKNKMLTSHHDWLLLRLVTQNCTSLPGTKSMLVVCLWAISSLITTGENKIKHPTVKRNVHYFSFFTSNNLNSSNNSWYFFFASAIWDRSFFS